MSTLSMIDGYRKTPLPIDSDHYGEELLLPMSVVQTIGRRLPKAVRGVSHENVLYIAGVVDINIRVGSVVIAPEAETGQGYFKTTLRSHQQVVRALADLDMEIVAQIHCHPGRGVSHSDGDDEFAFIKGEGFWSLVVPEYGKSGMLPLSRCGMHCFTGGAFRLLDPEASAARVRLIPDYLDLRKKK